MKLLIVALLCVMCGVGWAEVSRDEFPICFYENPPVTLWSKGNEKELARWKEWWWIIQGERFGKDPDIEDIKDTLDKMYSMIADMHIDKFGVKRYELIRGKK